MTTLGRDLRAFFFACLAIALFGLCAPPCSPPASAQRQAPTWIGPPSTLGPLTPQPTNLQGTQIVDPQNKTTVASTSGTSSATVTGYDGNNYTGRVWTSYAALSKAWGTTAPVFNSAVTLVWASSRNASDPVVLDPLIFGTDSPFLLIGPALTISNQTTLSAVTPKNTAAGTNSMLLVTAAGNWANHRIVNTTRSGSFAYGYFNTTGSQWAVSQPLPPQTYNSLNGATPPVENNSWASGDSVEIGTAGQIELVLFRPVTEDVTNVTAVLLGFDVYALDPLAITTIDSTYSAVAWGDIIFPDTSSFIGSPTLQTIATSTWCTGQLTFQGTTTVWGGGIGTTSPGASFLGVATTNLTLTIDLDYVLYSNETFLFGFVNLGNVAIDGPQPLQIFASTTVCSKTVYAGAFATSTATISLRNQTRLFFVNTSTAAATWTFPAAIASGLFVTGNSHTIAEASSLTTTVTATPANIDAHQPLIATNLGSAISISSDLFR